MQRISLEYETGINSSLDVHDLLERETFDSVIL